MLPLAAVAIPVSIIVTAISTGMFLTTWSDEDVTNAATVSGETPQIILFVLVVLGAGEALFGQVARAATVIALAGTVRGERPSITEALDPAFTRIGGLLLVFIAMLTIGMVGIVTIVGIVLLPYIFGRLGVALEAFMLEELSPMEALRRSWGLMQGRIIRFLGLMILAIGCVLPVLFVLSIIGGSISGSRTQELLLVGGWSMVQGAALVPVVAFLTACTTLYYLKARELANGSARS